jgi:hypothetical protein
MYRNFRIAIMAGLAVLALPAGLQAQRGAGPRRGGGMGNPVAPLIDMRRELNLSARQLTQLDSIERTLLARNRTVRERLQARMDTTMRAGRGQQLTDEQRTVMRARMDSMRVVRSEIVRNDSTARAAALRVLTDSQRTQVQLRQAERRGFAAGRAAAQRGQRGFRGGDRPGVRRQAQPMGPRNRMGMRGGAVVRPPAGGMGPGQRGFQGQRGLAPGSRPGPMGGGIRRINPDGVGPDDRGLAPRRRGMMRGDLAPADSVPPVRRPPADSII